MTCSQARDRFSDVVDERVTVAERGALDDHLAGCAACRHELERFRETVALLRSIEPARAPAGFVDRVLAVQSRPWWRRVAARLLFPLPVKLPVEAAAILLVGVGVAYVFQRTPELREAARVDAPVVAERPAVVPDAQGPTPSSPPATAERDASPPPPTAAPSPAPGRVGPPPAAQDAESARSVFDASSAPRATAPEPVAPPRADTARREDEVRARERVATAPGTPAPSADVGALREEGARAELPRQPRDERGAAAREQRLAAKAAAPLGPSGTLAVASRAAAEAAVRDIAARHRGQVIGTRTAAGATIVEVRVPRDEYPGFIGALPGLGRWTPDPEPGDLSADVRITLRLVD